MSIPDGFKYLYTLATKLPEYSELFREANLRVSLVGQSFDSLETFLYNSIQPIDD